MTVNQFHQENQIGNWFKPFSANLRRLTALGTPLGGALKLVTYKSNGALHPGVVLDGDRILNLADAIRTGQAQGLVDSAIVPPSSILEVVQNEQSLLAACNKVTDAVQAGELPFLGVSASETPLAAPIPRPLKNVFCVGSNYRAHVSEASKAQSKQDKVPKLPVFFTKPPTAVVGPDEDIRLEPFVSDKMDYEVELAVIIGKAGRNISKQNAMDHVFGFSIVNDVTLRDLQRAHGGQFLKGKGLDTTCPFGPQIVTIDEVPDFDNLRIGLTVNEEIRQDGNTRDMIFDIPTLIESLSEGLTLEPGDILATGTPSGVGYAMEPPHWLKDGDVVTCEVEKIGRLSNKIKKDESMAMSV